MVQPSVVPRPAAAGDSPPKHIILNTLKTGMKLDGYVVSSTPYAAFIDAGVVRVSKGGGFAPVHAMLHKSDIPKEVLRSLQKGQHQFPSPIPGPTPLLPKNTPLSVFVKEVTKQTGRFTVTTDSTVTKEDLGLEHRRVREEASERRRSRRLRRQLENVTPGTTAEGLVDKVVDEGVLVTITSLGSLNVTGLIRKQDMPHHLRVPESIKVSHQNQLLQQDFVSGRPITCAISEVHPTPHTANVYNLKLTFEDFNGQIEDDEPVEDIFDTMTAKEQKAWLLNRKVEDLNDDDDQEEEEEDGYDNEEEGEENERDDFEQDFGNFDQEVTELYEELLSASAERTKGKSNPARLLPVESVYDWDAVQDMISSGELKKSDVDQAIRRAGVPLRGGTLSLAQFKDVVEGLQDKMHADEVEEEDGYGSEEEQETEELKGLLRDAQAAQLQQQQQYQKKGEGEQVKVNREDEYDEYNDDEDGEGYDLQYGEDDLHLKGQDNYEDSRDDGDDRAEENGEEEEEEQSFDEIVTEVFDELKNEQGLVPVSAFKAWEDVQDMVAGGVIRRETLDMLIEEIVKSTPSVGGKHKPMKPVRNKKMTEPALTFDQFSQLVRLLDEMVTAQEDAADFDREQLENKRVPVPEDGNEEDREDDGDDYQDEEGYENDDDEDNEARGELSEEEQDAIDAADAKEAFQELSKDGKVVTVKSLRAWDEIRDLLEEEILDQESLDVLIRTANGDLTSPMNLETFTDLLTLINDAVNSAEGDGDDDGEYADYDDDENEEEGQEEEEVRDYLNPRSTHTAQKVSASVDEREAQRARLNDRDESRNLQEEEEEEEGEDEDDEEDPSDEELEILAKQAYDELLPKGRTTLPVKVFETWQSVQEEVTAGMLTNEEIRSVLKKVDPRNTHQLTFEQFTTAMDMLEMKIQERAEEMEQQELDDAQERDGEDDENYDDSEEDGHYEDEERDGYSVDFDEYDDIDEVTEEKDPSASAPAAAHALPSTTSAISTASQSAKSPASVPNKASPAKSVPSGPGVGFDKVTLPDTKSISTGTAPVKKGKKSADENVVQVPTSLEDTEKEIDQLMEEMTQALYDELRGTDAVLTVEKFKQWKELQDIFNEGVVSKSFFDRAVKTAGASATGPISWKQFGAVLDAVQSEAEKSFPEDDASDDDDGDGVDEAEIARAKEAHAKALAKVQEKAARAQKVVAKPTATTVAAGLDEESTRKNENYDFSKMFETLEEIEQKETGKRKSKKAAAAATPAPVPTMSAATTASSASPRAVSDLTAGSDAHDKESDDEDEYPVEQGVDELAQETYDRLRGAQAQPTVGDLLHWEDIIELIDRRALTGEQLVQALSDAKINPDKEKDAVSLEKFLKAVQNIDQYIDFTKLDTPDLSHYDERNMMIHGAGTEIDELLRDKQLQDARIGGAASTSTSASAASGGDIDDDGTDEPRETPKTTKRKSKASATATAKEKAPKDTAASTATSKTSSKAASKTHTVGAENTPAVSGLPVEVVPVATPSAETAQAQATEKVKKPRKSKKAASVVLDTVAVEDKPSEDAEIKEMFAELSKGKGYVTEKALRSWGEIQELLQANLLTSQDLDFHLRELNLPTSGKVEYPQFEKFVRQLDEVLIDENGDFLPADQKHRAVNLNGVSEFDE